MARVSIRRRKIVRQYRSGDVRHIVADPARAPEVLGFAAGVEPRVGLRQWAAS
jgi:dTDP-L-rhamnose 4-epimerase